MIKSATPLHCDSGHPNDTAGDDVVICGNLSQDLAFDRFPGCSLVFVSSRRSVGGEVVWGWTHGYTGPGIRHVCGKLAQVYSQGCNMRYMYHRTHPLGCCNHAATPVGTRSV
jgi:hypothetical protein